MGFFDNFTGAAATNDLRAGTRNANAYLTTGRNEAESLINSGYNRGNRALGNAQGVANDQNNIAVGALDQARDSALTLYNPYVESGTRANALYSDALGLNGAVAQRDFNALYAGSDPFRESNADFATNALMRSLNARGMSGSGFAAEAVARENLRRGSEDYNNYLNRLYSSVGMGLNAASDAAGTWNNWGSNRANQAQGYANLTANIARDRATNYANQGNALADLTYGYNQQRAGNAINMANATAANRATGWNNALKVGEVAVKAFKALTGAG